MRKHFNYFASGIILLSGCATQQRVPVNIPVQRADIPAVQPTMPAPVAKPIVPAFNTPKTTPANPPKDIVSLEAEVEKSLQQLAVVSEKDSSYVSEFTSILNDLKEQKYYGVNERVCSLYAKAQKDSFPSRNALLENLKNFSYTKLVFVPESHKKEEIRPAYNEEIRTPARVEYRKSVNPIAVGAVAASFAALSIFAITVNNGLVDKCVKEERIEIPASTRTVHHPAEYRTVAVAAHYKKVRIAPVTGIEEVIEDNIPAK